MDLLLLEDDPDLGRAVAGYLVSAGHRVQWCKTISDARDSSERQAPSLALIDLRLPDGDGLDLLRFWRSAGQGWPVIVLTARDQVSDRIRGLQAGADDYLVKPFDLDELLARVEAVARRMATPRRIRLGDATGDSVMLDLDQRALWQGGRYIDLTQMEWAVLDCLSRRPGRIYSRSEIEARLHGEGLADAASNSIEVIVSRLRKKMGATSITTHRGLGYRLEA